MSEKLFPLPAGNHLIASALNQQVIKCAQAEGLEVYVVGGYLRDLVLSKTKPTYKLVSKDLDYAIKGGSAFSFAKKIGDQLQAHFVGLDEKNDTARLVLPDGHMLDFAGCAGNSIEEDIKRRDFTVNSLYLDPKNPNVIVDLSSGIADIEEGIIRTPDKSILISDPLRLLRAFRFASKLRFSIESKTLSWIKDYCNKITEVAKERVSSELFIIFSSPDLGYILKALADCGLLEMIFPELSATRKVTANAYHHLNLFDHSLEAVIEAEKEYVREPIWLNQTNLQNEAGFAVSRLALCQISTLLHDIGKPATWIITDTGKHTFIGHERLGAQMSCELAERLRWSKHAEHIVSKLICFHLRPGQLFHQQVASAKAINRLYRQAGEDMPALILLALGDLAATCGPEMTNEKREFLRDKFYSLLNGYYDYCLTTEQMQKLLDGNDVMNLRGLPPGKEVGEILLALQEAQESKEVVDRSQAEEFVRKYRTPSI